MLFNIYRFIQFFYFRVNSLFTNEITKLLFVVNNVRTSSLKSNGIPKLFIQGKSSFTIGKNFKMNNTTRNNPIGRNEQCIFVIKKNGILSIGNNVGMSGTSIVCRQNIKIDDNVKIGGNVCIYDTDFHSLKSLDRLDSISDRNNTVNRSIYIGKNVFIGAHSTILKGVYIGDNSIIGACSVVTKQIPPNQIWAGNPAKFVRDCT